jgi:hypothetical protein
LTAAMRLRAHCPLDTSTIGYLDSVLAWLDPAV